MSTETFTTPESEKSFLRRTSRVCQFVETSVYSSLASSSGCLFLQTCFYLDTASGVTSTCCREHRQKWIEHILERCMCL